MLGNLNKNLNSLLIENFVFGILCQPLNESLGSFIPSVYSLFIRDDSKSSSSILSKLLCVGVKQCHLAIQHDITIYRRIIFGWILMLYNLKLSYPGRLGRRGQRKGSLVYTVQHSKNYLSMCELGLKATLVVWRLDEMIHVGVTAGANILCEPG